MRIRCSNVGRCTTVIDFKRGYKQVGDKCFCSLDCALQFQEQSQIFAHAVEGAPILGRRQRHEKKWFARDG